MLQSYLQQLDAQANQLKLPELPQGLTWWNSEPLNLQALRDKLVLFDFWTYCCINCMHVLPDLEALEKKYADQPVVFIGVHSPKFQNEKDIENVGEAIRRYAIHHPVVHDPNHHFWQSLGISSWPTFVLAGPKNNMILRCSGEGNRELLEEYIDAALEYYRDQLVQPSSPPNDRMRIEDPRKLRYPGKLATIPDRQLLAISDSNNHRILLVKLDGEVVTQIGSGSAGLRDGDYRSAQFHRLQGLCYHDGLYVADAENHALRFVDLDAQTVSTLAGDGTQGRDIRGGNKGAAQQLSTPWDVTYDTQKNLLYIAMAGTHQIWCYDPSTGRTRNFSGVSDEQNRNDTNPLFAAWAQPSGLSIHRRTLYIADSESSSLRSIDLEKGATATLVGGDPYNPANLFHFGDTIGPASSALLQHPLGVLALPDGRVLIADTYNHRIKSYDPVAKEVENVAGTGSTGARDGVGPEAQFSEPSGLALHPNGKEVFIADTNNHRIRKLSLETNAVTTLPLKGLETLT